MHKYRVENLLGEIGRGHVIAFNILNIGRYKLGVGTVGGSKRALEIAVTICKPTSTIQNTNLSLQFNKRKTCDNGIENICS